MFEDGDFTASLGNLCQCLITSMVNFFPQNTYNQNFICSKLSVASSPITVHLWKESGSDLPIPLPLGSHKSPHRSYLGCKIPQNDLFFIWIIPDLSTSSCTSSAPACCASWWPSRGLASVCPCLPCTEEPKTRHRTSDVVSHVLNGGQYSLPTKPGPAESIQEAAEHRARAKCPRNVCPNVSKIYGFLLWVD